MILFTMDDNINSVNFKIYEDLLDQKFNPSGCPVKATFFVSGEFNDYNLTKNLFDKGNINIIYQLLQLFNEKYL